MRSQTRIRQLPLLAFRATLPTMVSAALQERDHRSDSVTVRPPIVPLYHAGCAYIFETNNPDGGIIEQVWDGFTDEIDRNDEEHQQAISDAQITIQNLQSKGFEVRPAKMSTKDWMDVSRVRNAQL